MGPAAHGVDWNRAHRLPIPVKGRFWAARGQGYLCVAREVTKKRESEKGSKEKKKLTREKKGI